MTNKLKRYANNKFSQNGEDGIIEKIFEILPKQEAYWCVEFGAWDGKHLSNTYELIANQNWKGILIEGNPKKFPELIRTYQNYKNATLINKLVSFEGSNTLDNIFKETNIPIDFDLLSIDIDGNDYSVWESLKNYQPKIVVVEFNPTIPSDIDFIQEKNFALNHGNSLLSLIKLGKLKGYELIATTNCNGFFIKNGYFDLFEITDNSITSIWDTEKPAPRIFQLYDGTLVLSENFKLKWHKKHVKTYSLQILPKVLRFFGDSTNVKGFYKKTLRKAYYKLQRFKDKRR